MGTGDFLRGRYYCLFDLRLWTGGMVLVPRNCSALRLVFKYSPYRHFRLFPSALVILPAVGDSLVVTCLCLMSSLRNWRPALSLGRYSLKHFK